MRKRHPDEILSDFRFFRYMSFMFFISLSFYLFFNFI